MHLNHVLEFFVCVASFAHYAHDDDDDGGDDGGAYREKSSIKIYSRQRLVQPFNFGHLGLVM